MSQGDDGAAFPKPGSDTREGRKGRLQTVDAMASIQSICEKLEINEHEYKEVGGRQVDV